MQKRQITQHDASRNIDNPQAHPLSSPCPSFTSSEEKDHTIGIRIRMEGT